MSNGQIAYQPGPTVHTDGTFSSPTGKLGIKVNADGTLTDLTDQKPLPLTITANAVTIEAQGQTAQIQLAADGTLVVPGETGSAVKVTGADTPGKRKLTLALIGLILLPSAHPAHSAPVETPASVPPPATDSKPPAPAAKPATPAAKSATPPKK